MKRLIFLVIAIVSISLTQAQVNFGVKAGLNLANLSGSDVSGTSIRASFNGGFLAQLPVADMLSVQPEVLYSGQGAKIKVDNGSGGTISGTYKLGYINVPVLLKYTTTSGFFVQTGPQIGFLLSAKASSGGASTDIKDEFKSTDFSWAFGLGYLSSMNIGLDARYNLGLSTIADGGTVRNSVIQIGVFYLLNERKSK